MSTKATMIERIADELRTRRPDRSDRPRPSSTQSRPSGLSASCFCETRALTFNTADGQEFYGSDDLADIPNIIAFDFVTYLDGNTVFQLSRSSRSIFEMASLNGTAKGSPSAFAYFAEQIRIYPVRAMSGRCGSRAS